MITKIMEEIYELSKAIGIRTPDTVIDETLRILDMVPHNSTPSLARDIWEGKPSEIEYQNGSVVKLGHKYGINTPVNAFIYNCILPLELKARSKKIF